jgi:hypothetical protein
MRWDIVPHQILEPREILFEIPDQVLDPAKCSSLTSQSPFGVSHWPAAHSVWFFSILLDKDLTHMEHPGVNLLILSCSLSIISIRSLASGRLPSIIRAGQYTVRGGSRDVASAGM